MDRVKSSNPCNGYPLRKSLIGMALIEKLVWKRVMQMMFYSVKISFLIYKTKDNNHIYQVDQRGYEGSLSLLPQSMKSFEITLDEIIIRWAAK